MHILLNSAYFRHQKIIRNAIIPEAELMTEHAVVVLELQRHVRICTSFDNIWIIDSLELHKQHDRRLATTRNPLVMTLSDVVWWTTLDVVVWARGSLLQFLTVKNIYGGQCNVKTSIISSEGISYSQMKVYIALPAQMAEQGSGKGMHASWKDHTSWCGNFKFEPVISQIINPGRVIGVMAPQYIDQALRPHVELFFAHHRNYTFKHDNAHVQSTRVTRDFLQ